MNYEKIKAVINASSLASQHKNELIDIFAEIDDNNLSDIANLFEKEKSWVEKFNDNRQAKLAAARKNDPSLWNEILEQEKKYLNDLTYGLD
jgi:hypothetical protein